MISCFFSTKRLGISLKAILKITLNIYLKRLFFSFVKDFLSIKHKFRFFFFTDSYRAYSSNDLTDEKSSISGNSYAF